MEKLRERKLCNKWLLTFIAFIFFYSCTKIEIQSNSNSSESLQISKDFFIAPPNTDPLVLRVLNEIKSRNNKNEFVTRFAEENGFPIWNKSILRHKTKTNINTSFSSSNVGGSTDTIIYIPLVLQNGTATNGFITAVINDSMNLNYCLSQDYKNYQFSTATSNAGATQFTSFLMLLDHEVFGHTEFEISDKRLFNFQNTHPNCSSVKIKLNYYDTTNSQTNLLNGVTSICWLEQTPASAGGTCTCGGNCWCWTDPTRVGCCSNQVCIVISVGSGNQPPGWPPSGGGGTSGGPSSGEGGGSLPHNYPCIPGPSNPNLTTSSIGADPLPPCPPPYAGTGWMPIVTPLGGSTLDPCDPFITALQSNTNFAAKFVALGTPTNLSLTYETGYLVQNISTNDFIGPIIGNATSYGGSIDWGPYSNYSGTLHAHFIGLQEMFAPRDIISLSKTFLQNQGGGSQNLFMGVATNSGPYLMKITDTAKFRILANKIAVDIAAENKFADQYKAKFLFINNMFDNEKQFLEMMIKMKVNGGFTLYRGNSNCDKWTALSLESVSQLVGPPIINIKEKDCF
jgi:hypothetical protein